jgi:hypothetical protein
VQKYTNEWQISLTKQPSNSSQTAWEPTWVMMMHDVAGRPERAMSQQTVLQGTEQETADINEVIFL